MREYLLILLVAAAGTYLMSALWRSIALRTGAMAKVRSRDVHTEPIPYFGGVAMFCGLSLAFLLAMQLPFLSRYAAVPHDALAVLLAGLIICVIGVFDDKYDMPWWVKLGGQGLAAGVAVLQGVRLYWIPLPDRIVALDDATSIVLTILVIAVCVNAVNFVDGLDGLAAGVVAIGSGAFFAYVYVLAYEQELVRATTASLITVATCGVCIGFLFHNWHPAKMFMGDSGSMLLGLLMAMSAVSYSGQLDPSALSEGTSVLPALLPIVVPVVALALPLADLVLAWVRRAWKGQSPFSPDKAHMHHRLLARGHSHQGAVLLMYGWTAVIAGGVVVMAITGQVIFAWVMGLAALVMLGLTLRPIHQAPARIGGADSDILDPRTSDG